MAAMLALSEIRLPERGHIETSMRDGTILPTTQGIKFIRRRSWNGNDKVKMTRDDHAKVTHPG